MNSKVDSHSTIWAISYSDETYSMSKKLCLFTAKYVGKANHIIAYSPEDLEERFKEENKKILSNKRGAGYWIWKPYIMLKTLERMNEGDFLIYTDAGLIYVNQITELTRQLDRDQKDIFLSYGIAPCSDWCKRDAFILMDCDCAEARDTIMVSGGYVLVRKSRQSIDFLNEWMRYMCDPRIVTDDANVCGYSNYPGYRENRHDQSVLSLLAWKWGIEPYKAVACVDQPSSHLNVKKNAPSAYKYSYQKILCLIYFEHQKMGYIRSDYQRIFINTRLRNMNILPYCISLIKTIISIWKQDAWGRKNNAVEIDRSRRRLLREGSIDETNMERFKNGIVG